MKRKADVAQNHLLLPLGEVRKLVKEYIHQDMPHWDVGALVVGDRPMVAHLLAKTDGVLAGVPYFDAVFEELGCSVEWASSEGDHVGPSHIASNAASIASAPGANAGREFDATDEHFKGRMVVATVKGPVCRLLQGERTSLNILSRASGIATATQALVAIKEANGWHGQIAATRKVTPGFRAVEKYAVTIGGGVPHRMSLSDMTMLKDNHVWACGGSISTMVKKARTACGFSNKIEVECQSVEEAMEAAEAGAEVVMLDNFPPDQCKLAAKKLKEKYPHGLTIEASGGMTAEGMVEFFSEHVDVISFGKLTHGYDVVDFSLKIEKQA